MLELEMQINAHREELQRQAEQERLILEAVVTHPTNGQVRHIIAENITAMSALLARFKPQARRASTVQCVECIAAV